EIGVLHLPGEGLAHRLLETARRIDVPGVAGHKERAEKRQPLDVVPMGMADQQVTGHRLRRRLHQLLPEAERAGAAIEHDQGPGRGAQFDAGCIAAVAHSWAPAWRSSRGYPRNI